MHAPGRTRTSDPQLRRLLLYPPELLAPSPPRVGISALPFPRVVHLATGRGDRIRTGDLLLPKQARYQATLRPASRKKLVGRAAPVNLRAVARTNAANARPRWLTRSLSVRPTSAKVTPSSSERKQRIVAEAAGPARRRQDPPLGLAAEGPLAALLRRPPPRTRSARAGPPRRRAPASSVALFASSSAWPREVAPAAEALGAHAGRPAERRDLEPRIIGDDGPARRELPEVARLGQRVLLERLEDLEPVLRRRLRDRRPRRASPPRSRRRRRGARARAASPRSASRAGPARVTRQRRRLRVEELHDPALREREQPVERRRGRRCRARRSPAPPRTAARWSSRCSCPRRRATSSEYSRSSRASAPISPTLIAATRRRTGVFAIEPRFTSQSKASTTATHAPVIDAVRVPPSACSTSQSTLIVYSPNLKSSSMARRLRPMSRWISCVRPPSCARSRALRVCVARGSIAYSAVSHPSPLPALPAGDALLHARRAEHARGAEGDETGALGVRRRAALEPDRAERIVGATGARGEISVGHGASR